MKTFIMARVSTKEQEEQGKSIAAKINKMKEYSIKNSLMIAEVFQLAESSTRESRDQFQEIVEKIKRAKKTVALVVDTIDRLQRSFKESVILDEYRKEGKLEIHFVRENLVIKKDSNSADLLRWDMGVMFARSYVLQLSDNVKRSFSHKIAKGEYPSFAPLGYLNVRYDNGNTDIVLDNERAELVKKIFEMYATGNHSIRSITMAMKEYGLTGRQKNKPISKSQIQEILCNPKCL